MFSINIDQALDVAGDYIDLADATLTGFEPLSGAVLTAADLALSAADFHFKRDAERTEAEYEEAQHIGAPDSESPLAEVSLDLNLLNYSEDPDNKPTYSQAA